VSLPQRLNRRTDLPDLAQVEGSALAILHRACLEPDDARGVIAPSMTVVLTFLSDAIDRLGAC
jgi:hypothetical protein